MSGELRKRVVEEALSWEGTPYVSNAQVKGRQGGVDCLTYIAAVYENAGVIDKLPIPYYPPDWHMHNDVEFYLFGKDDTPGMMHFCEEVPGPPERLPLPGDIIMIKIGQCFSHAAIVTEWPMIVHAVYMANVQRDDANRRPDFIYTLEKSQSRRGKRERKFLKVKGW